MQDCSYLQLQLVDLLPPLVYPFRFSYFLPFYCFTAAIALLKVSPFFTFSKYFLPFTVSC